MVKYKFTVKCYDEMYEFHISAFTFLICIRGLFYMKTAIAVVHLVICVAIIAIVVLQSGKTSGLSGALSGSSDTFLSKNKSKTLDARLARATKWFAGVFVILTVVLNLI